MSIVRDDLVAKLSFGLPDRLGKALDVAGVSGNEMADYLGVTRTTISNYTNGRTAPKKSTLRLWAMRCGVPLGWIETGILESQPDDGPDGGGTVVTSPADNDSRRVTRLSHDWAGIPRIGAGRVDEIVPTKRAA